MGSAESRRIGLRLLVPAFTLVVPVALLLAGLVATSQAGTSLAATTVRPLAPPVQVAIAASDADAREEDLGFHSVESPDDVAASVETVPARPVAVETLVSSEPTPLPTPRQPLPTPTPRDAWSGPPTFTFVALGVDQRNDLEIPRTDTIMIGKVDLRGAGVRLVSIPRDLVVDIPGYGQDRINTAYVYGEQFKEPDGGIGLLRRTIEKNFGIRIDHFGLVDFQCFRTAVDAVGGVSVNVPRAIVDPRYPTDDYGVKLVRFEVGPQRMDGERALEYARTRNADNDFHRIQRQQLILAALREQVLQLRALPALPAILGGCRNMRSDLGWRDYISLATTLRTLDRERISFAAIDERMVLDTVLPTGAAVLLPRWDRIRVLVRESFSEAGPPGLAASPTPEIPLAAPLLAPSPSPRPVFRPVADSAEVIVPLDHEADTSSGGALDGEEG